MYFINANVPRILDERIKKNSQTVVNFIFHLSPPLTPSCTELCITLFVRNWFYKSYKLPDCRRNDDKYRHNSLLPTLSSALVLHFFALCRGCSYGVLRTRAISKKITLFVLFKKTCYTKAKTICPAFLLIKEKRLASILLSVNWEGLVEEWKGL